MYIRHNKSYRRYIAAQFLSVDSVPTVESVFEEKKKVAIHQFELRNLMRELKVLIHLESGADEDVFSERVTLLPASLVKELLVELYDSTIQVFTARSKALYDKGITFTSNTLDVNDIIYHLTSKREYFTTLNTYSDLYKHMDEERCDYAMKYTLVGKKLSSDDYNCDAEISKLCCKFKKWYFCEGVAYTYKNLVKFTAFNKKVPIDFLTKVWKSASLLETEYLESLIQEDCKVLRKYLKKAMR